MNLAEAEARNQSAARRALREAQDAVIEYWAAGNLTSIDATALRQRESWNGQAWDWQEALNEISKDPRRFSLAIWQGDTLCGLALGKVGRSGKHVSVALMEGNPDEKHPLKGNVIKIVMAFGIALCREHGARELRFVNPLPAVIPLYEAYGFALEKTQLGMQYMCKEV